MGGEWDREVCPHGSHTTWECKLGKVLSRFCLPDFHTVSIQEEVVGGNYASAFESMSGEDEGAKQGTPRVGGQQA